MSINKKLSVLAVCFLALPISFVLAQEVDARTKITDSLIELKRLIIIEETFAQAANDRLSKENSLLLEENARLKKTVRSKTPVNIKEKIVYRLDSSREKRIAELEQKILELNKLAQINSGNISKNPELEAANQTSFKPQKSNIPLSETTGCISMPQENTFQPGLAQKLQNNGFIYRKIN